MSVATGARWLVPVVVLALLACAGPAAAAKNDKPYRAVVTPDPVSSGTHKPMTVSLSVPASSQQQLGSLELTSPFAIRSVSAPPSVTVTQSGNTARFLNLALQPGSSMTLTVTVDVPCTPGLYDWRAVGKQANDFNGPPGNDLTLTSDSDLRTQVSGGCFLRFNPEPQDARVGERITGTDYQPAAAPVAVEVVDANGAVITGASPSITLDLGLRSGMGTLRGTRTVTATAGVAAFDVSVDAPGTYTLVASSPGYQSAASAPFAVNTVAVFCPEDQPCPPGTQVSSSRSTVNVDAAASGGAGYLTLSLNGGPQPDCANHTELSGDWAVVNGPDRTKVVTYRIDRRVMNAAPNNGAAFLELCYGAPEPFTAKGGAAAPFDAAFGGYVGLLPDCSGAQGAPCVRERRKDGAGDGIIVAQGPPGDPAYRP